MKPLSLPSLAFAAATLLALPALCLAQEVGPAQNALTDIQKNLSDSKAKQEALTQSIIAAQKAADEISDKLVEQSQKVEADQLAFAAANQKLTTLETRAIVLRSDLAAKQKDLSLLLAALQRLDLEPPPALIVKPDNVLEAVRSAMLFGAVVPEMRDQAKAVQSNLDELSAIQEETEKDKSDKANSLAALESSKADLIKLQLEKKVQSASAAQDLEAEKAKSLELAAKAHSLQDLLAALEKQRIEQEAKKAADAKAAELAAAAMKRQQDEVAMRAALPLSQAKGKLALPVNGKIIKHFGDTTTADTKLEGMALSTEPNVNVISPTTAKVEFAGNFKSYGQLLILNAGEGYLVLISGMKQISVEAGQTIKSGEPIGQMGEGPSTLAVLGSPIANPVLYIEFRKDNNPIDPTPWWATDRKEAMK